MAMDGRERRSERAEAPGQEAAAARRRFFTHLAVYLAVNLLLFVTDVVGGGGWWFFWPLLGWGIGIAAHAANAFGFGGSQRAGRSLAGAPSVAPTGAPAAAPAAVPVDARALGQEAETRVARLWRVARRIEAPAAREQAFRVCAAADRVAEALAGGAGDATVARAFLDRYLGPAEGVLDRYVRLAGRGVAAAEPTLVRVEEHDLPLLETKLTELYEHIHRGDVIDLEVAREMLELDLETGPPRPQRRPPLPES
jgi:hypothetical protein